MDSPSTRGMTLGDTPLLVPEGSLTGQRGNSFLLPVLQFRIPHLFNQSP